MSDTDATAGLSPDEKITREARRRFHVCEEWESTARTRFVEDEKFCYGDADNRYQWNSTLYQTRESGGKPCLTINKTKQHCLQIINDARQNKAGIEVRPVGEGASVEAAEIFEGVVRHIEYISNAQAAYDTATWNQVVGGIGWWRVITDYASDDSFNQEIFIRRVPDALSIYLDPDIQQYDGSDAKYGFVFRNMPKDEFDAAYPKLKGQVGTSVLDEDVYGASWWDEEHVRVVEYYRKVEDKQHLIALVDGSTMREEDAAVGDLQKMVAMAQGFDPTSMDPDALAALDPMDAVRRGPDGEPLRREIAVSRVEWFLIAGDKIADRSTVPGTYIPLVRVVGEETVIDGQMDRRGHTRALKDPQRMYNYYSSRATELMALQTNVPWMVSLEAVEGAEEYYKNANTENFAYLPWRERDENGNPNTKPERIMPPQMGDSVLKGMQFSASEMMMVSGQYQAVMGAPSNETSGKAINARQRQGDNATYHFIDHLAQAMRFTGKILLQWIPLIYDTERVMRVIAENGDESEVHIDPQAKMAHQAIEVGQPTPGTPGAPQMPSGTSPDSKPDVRIIFNPRVGKYDVIADVGPAYATQRQEAFNAFVQIMQANPDLMGAIGDLMFKAADFPMAQDIAERLNEIRTGKTVPKELVDKLQAALAETQKRSNETIGTLAQQLASAQLARQKVQVDAARTAGENRDGGRDSVADLMRVGVDATKAHQQHSIAEYDAETRRMAAMGNIDAEALKPLVRELVSQLLQEPVVPLMAAHAEADQARMPKEAPDNE